MTKTRDDQADRTAELSEAARAAVRDPGDPRIDAHLAALGLGPDPEPAPKASMASRRDRGTRDDTTPLGDAGREDLTALRAQVASLEAAQAAARARTRLLTAALVAAVAGDVLLLLLLVVRAA